MKRVDLIVDLQFGSTGKGLIAGWLGTNEGPNAVINANMPNAGHTYIDEFGNEMVFKVLPNSIVSKALSAVFLGPGSVINLDRLITEIEVAQSFGYMCEKDTWLVVHSNACILRSDHVLAEAKALSSISSTMQGSAEAVIEKMRRKNPDIIAKNNQDKLYKIASAAKLNMAVVSGTTWHDLLCSYDYIVAEGAQGYSLSLNGHFWPFCTSRDCTPHRIMSEMGMPMIRETIGGTELNIIGTARTYPIRVGNTADGFSGSHYSDQEEISWGDIGVKPERTTVTNRERRVFTFSEMQIAEAIRYCQPDKVFLNFANYLEYQPWRLQEIIDMIQKNGPSVKFLGYGPTHHDVKVLN
jgi:adenylosuccinate synthase